MRSRSVLKPVSKGCWGKEKNEFILIGSWERWSFDSGWLGLLCVRLMLGNSSKIVVLAPITVASLTRIDMI